MELFKRVPSRHRRNFQRHQGALKQFLSSNVEISQEEEKFKHSYDADGRIRSICYECFESVAVSFEIADIELAESIHECPRASIRRGLAPVRSLGRSTKGICKMRA